MRLIDLKYIRNSQIDGLRGITILLIAIFHFFSRFNEIYFNEKSVYIHWLGNFGNCIFFLISSFFLVSLDNHNFNWLFFLKKKILRLWPTYFLCITITMLVTSMYHLPGRTVSFMDYILNILMVNAYLGRPYVDGAHWYLTTLIGATLIVCLIRKFKLETYSVIYLIWLFIEALTAVFNIHFINILLGGSNSSVICIGIAYKLIKTNNNSKNCYSINLRYKILNYLYKWRYYGLILISLVYFYLRKGLVGLLCLLLAILLLSLVTDKKLQILKSRIFLFLGMISYPFYLTHQNIGYVIQLEMVNNLNDFNMLYVSFIALIVTLILGGTLTFIFELPIQKFIKEKLL